MPQYDSDVKDAQIDYVFDQLIVTGWPHTIAACVTAGVIWYATQSVWVFVWLGVLLVSHIMRIVIVDRIWRARRGSGDYWLVRRMLVMGMAYAGGLWGLVAVLFMNDPYTESVIFISIALAGMCAATLPALAAYLPAYWAYMVPTLSLLTFKLLALGLSATALLGVACLTAFVVISTKIHQIITTSITMDFQNRALLEQVTEAKEKAEQANRAKSKFLAVASHDLRQPLQALGLILESLKLRSQKQNSDQLSLVRQGVDCHDALSELFNSLMDLSRLESNDLNVTKGNVKLKDLVEMLVKEFQPAAENKGLYLRMQAQDCVALTDPLVFSRILRNLLSNAIKFTQSGGIEVALFAQANDVVVSVSDTGVGIPLDEQDKVFEEYHQVSAQTRLRQQGVGLGLSVVQRLTVLLDHEVTLQSEPGKGTTFSIVAPQGGVSAVIRQDDAAEFSLIGCRVLLVDDEPGLLKATCSLLRDWGCEVMEASDMESALALLHDAAPPQIIVTDFHLGVIDAQADTKKFCTGMDVIEAVHNELQQVIPALLMSGDTSPELIAQMRKRSLYLLQKPVKPVHLRKVMRQLLASESTL
jgi:signal transduction histidine kinase